MASTIPGHTLPKMPRPADELLTIERIAYVVGVPVATSRHWLHVGIDPRGVRIGPSVRDRRAEVLQFVAGVESSENAGAFANPARTRVTAGGYETLLGGQHRLRPRTLDRHPAGAVALGGSLPPHGAARW